MNTECRKKYENWDWTKRDIDLGKEKEITRERVRQIRKNFCFPRSPMHKKGFAEVKLFYLKNKLTNMSVREIADFTNLSYYTVFPLVKKLNIKTKSGYSKKEEIEKQTP